MTQTETHATIENPARGLLPIRWCGFDYGETLMDPSGLRNPLLFGDVCGAWGRPELARDMAHAYRVLREAYGEYYTVKEGHREEVFTHVLSSDLEAQRIFMDTEPRLLGTAEHLHETLTRLRNLGLVLDIVSELIRTVGAIEENVILRFLATHHLRAYFRFLITPLGKIDVQSGRLIDERYCGHTKGAGTIYDVLVGDLAEQGVAPSQAVMIGDRPGSDIEPAHARGLRTVQYSGYSRYPASNVADAVVEDMRLLPPLLALWNRQEPTGADT